jgi:hypothetical protein
VNLGNHGVFGRVATNNVRRAQLFQQWLVASDDNDSLDIRELCKLYCELAAVGTTADDKQAAWARFVILPRCW